MRSYRWDGDAVALSSISHGGETLGTVTYLRREAFLTPTGRVEVPVISGNAVRGALRDVGAQMTWEALGRPRLPLPIMHALWSGGALVKAKSAPLTGQRLATLRRLVPHIGVFGAAGGGRIIDGALVVGKLVPVCAQTAHLLPDRLREPDGGARLPDVHDLLQIERYSRIPDADRLPDIYTAPARTRPAAGDGLGTGDGPDAAAITEAVEEGFEDGLMRYGTETFVAGTRFTALFALNHATDPEYAFFADVLHTWLPTATVGGKTGRGHGQVAFTLTDPSTRPGAVPDPLPQWRTFTGAPIADVLDALSWLD